MLVDIDELKRGEQRIQAALTYAESIVETIREPLLVLGPELEIERANRSFYDVFKVSPAEIKGRKLDQLRVAPVECAGDFERCFRKY